MTTSDASAILKEVYGSAVADQLNNEVRELQHFEKSESAEWLGEAFIEALHTGRNYSTKAVAESGTLPTAGKQSYAQLSIPNRYVYATIEVTAQLMSEVKDKGAFVNAMDREVNGAVRDMKVELNRIIWGDGYGKLALLSASGGDSTTLNLDAPMGVAGTTNGARFIKPGMYIAIHPASPSNNTPNVTRLVSSVAADGSTIVVDSAVSDAQGPNNAIITKGYGASGTEGSYDIEPMGILGLVDDGTYRATIHGLSRTSTPIFKANTFSSVGNLDEIIFWRALDTCDEIAGGEPNWFACHHSVHREYVKISLDDKRYSGEALMRPDVGISGGGKKHELTFSNTPIEKCRYAPYGHFFGIDDSKLKKYVNVEGKWIDEDGAILHRGAGTTDSFKATYRKFGNYGILQCNTSFILKGINATVDVVNAL